MLWENARFFISETHLFSGASPDSPEKGCLIEVKKVTSKDGESKEDTLCRLAIYTNHMSSTFTNFNNNYSVVSVHNHILLFQMVFG